MALKQGAQVEVTVEAEPEDTIKKDETINKREGETKKKD